MQREVLYDPIHGIISFSSREKRVIDHPFVQRLRFIRQLGLKFLVYPGAVHDRFGHALGAMHLAGLVWSALDEKHEVWRRLPPSTRKKLFERFRFAALLHDLGHGPFSHASEALMPRLDQLAIPKHWYERWRSSAQATHEDYGALLLFTLSREPENVFTPAEAQDIASLLHKAILPSVEWRRLFRTEAEAKGYHRFLRRLISGELDVDRMDYLLRDAHFTGVPYGKYDLPWLLQTMSAVVRQGCPSLVLHERGLRTFEDFLLARYHMFLQVYFHRTTAIFEHYVERAIREGEIAVSIPSDPYAYAELRDSGVLEAMFQAGKDPRHRWSRLLLERQPMRLILATEGRDQNVEGRVRRVKSALAAAGIKSVQRLAHRALSEPRLRLGASGIFIQKRFLDRLTLEPLEKVSTLLQKYNQQIYRQYLYVWPEDYERACGALHKVKGLR
ncbi:HD domain-containing protein [Candidatus Uhrbacteria bacterium]|nr:HD domain-containing protein [Candidatus Uhrbacteria bacterium]